MAQVDIIIPTYNNSEYTVELLKGVRAHTSDYRIILVDNASEEAELDVVLEALDAHELVTIVRNTQNEGFIKAVNKGFRISTAPFVCIQNNDTLVEEQWLEKILEVFEQSPKIGLVGPTTIWADSWQNRDNIDRQWNNPWGPPPWRKVNSMLAFFSVVIKREVIEEVGTLPEEYGIGFGDDDEYCAIARELGWQLFLRTDVTVPHYHRTTFKKYIPNWRELQKKNIALYHERNK